MAANERQSQELKNREWRSLPTFWSGIFQAPWRRRTGIVTALTLFGSLFALLIFALLFAPTRTHVVALSLTDYEFPFPPNSWAYEDLQRVSLLDGKTVTLHNASAAVRSRDDMLHVLRHGLSGPSISGESVIIYVSAHGFTDASGNPILAPPAATPENPDSWVTMDQLLSTLHEALPNKKKLLILDCKRFQTQWNLGVLYNSFSVGLEQLWEERRAEYPNLAILCSASAGERAWSSADLRSSVFGLYVFRGLAGAADLQSASKVSAARFTNRRVSVSELYKYVKREVGHWTKLQRAAVQQPMLLLPSERFDFELVWTLEGKQLRDLLLDDEPAQTPPQDLTSLWTTLADIRQAHPYRCEPHAWHELELRMLWLERLHHGGKAYVDAAARNRRNLEVLLADVKGRADRAQQSRTAWDQYGIVSGKLFAAPQSLRVHSLPLCEYFGTLSVPVITQARDAVSRIRLNPSDAALSAALQTLDAKVSPIELVERRFLHMLNRYQWPDFWQRTSTLRRILTLRRANEELAVPGYLDGLPGDERAQRWSLPLVAQADQFRRIAEDRLFVDQDMNLEEPLSSAELFDHDAKSVATDMATALQYCDQASAEMPYLAHWLCDPLVPAQQRPERSELIQNQLIPTIRRLQRVSSAIAEYDISSAEPHLIVVDSQEIKKESQEIWQIQHELQQQLAIECRRLAEGSSVEAQHLREIEAALSVPTIPVPLRRGLWQRYATVSRELYSQFAREDPVDVAAPDRDAADPDRNEYAAYSRWASGWDIHPALAFLGDDTRAGGRDLNYMGHVLSRFTFLPPRDEPRANRSDWAKAAQRFRALCGISVQSPSVEPIGRLREFDFQQLLLWHAERALDDFWGAAGSTRAFYELAAQDYLRGAESLSSSASRDVEKRNQLEQRLGVQRVLANGLITLQANNTLLIERGDDVTVTVKTASPVEQEDDVPLGTAALLIRDGLQRMNGRYGALPLRETATERRLSIDGAQLLDEPFNLRAEVAFRGHEFSDTFDVEKLGGVTVDYRPHTYNRTRVTLDDPRQKWSFAFILDCSQSMAEKDPAVDGQDVPRLEVAKRTLLQMLGQLSRQANARAGVWLFGHRVGWSTDRPVQVLTQLEYPGEIPEGLSPNNDVEYVVAFDNLESEAVDAVSARLRAVKAWGQSPLYLAVREALTELATEDGDAQKHVIVLSDSVNYVFSTAQVGSPELTDIQDILSTWQGTNIPIHVLRVARNDDDVTPARQEFVQLAQSTGGQYRTSERAAEFLALLDELLAPHTYEIAEQDRVLFEAELGSPVSLRPSQQTADDLIVRFESVEEPVSLAGGEALELYVDHEKRAIYAYPYDYNVAAQARLVHGQDGAVSDCLLRVHRPERVGDDVHIEVSLQRIEQDVGLLRSAWRATPRPREAWIEITPQLSDGTRAGDVYLFYDRNYEPEKPVPVIQCVAADWPQAATKAGVKCWFSPLTARPASRLPLREFATPQASDGMEMKLPGHIVLSASVNEHYGSEDRYRIRVIERHGTSSAGIGSLKVALPELSNILPARVIRRFDPNHNVAVHYFLYAPSQADDIKRLSSDAIIPVTTREDVHQDAWRLATDELVVSIASPGELMDLSPDRTSTE